MALKFTQLLILLFAVASIAAGQAPLMEMGRRSHQSGAESKPEFDDYLKSDNEKISGSIIGADPGETPIDWAIHQGGFDYLQN